MSATHLRSPCLDDIDRLLHNQVMVAWAANLPAGGNIHGPMHGSWQGPGQKGASPKQGAKGVPDRVASRGTPTGVTVWPPCGLSVMKTYGAYCTVCGTVNGDTTHTVPHRVHRVPHRVHHDG